MSPSVIGIGGVVHLARTKNKPFQHVGIGKSHLVLVAGFEVDAIFKLPVVHDAQQGLHRHIELHLINKVVVHSVNVHLRIHSHTI